MWNKKEIAEFLEKTLNECPEFPCRVDEMTPREFGIALVVFHLCGAMTFLKGELNEN
jgi:hypothetical protein